MLIKALQFLVLYITYFHFCVTYTALWPIFRTYTFSLSHSRLWSTTAVHDNQHNTPKIFLVKIPRETTYQLFSILRHLRIKTFHACFSQSEVATGLESVAMTTPVRIDPVNTCDKQEIVKIKSLTGTKNTYEVCYTSL